VEPLTGEVFRMPHETELWDTHVLFYRHRIFSSPSCGSFFDLPLVRFCTGCAEGESMYYDQHVCGARIQELRKSKGYTQEALAEAIDIDAKRISKIERGVISASYNDMILFSEFFGVTLDYLIIGKRQDVDALKKRVQDAITQLQEALM